jgi:hypothetical protein
MYSVWYMNSAGYRELLAEDEDIAWVMIYARQIATKLSSSACIIIATAEQPIVKIKGSSI